MTTSRTRSGRLRLASTALLLPLALAACGGEAEPAATAAPSSPATGQAATAPAPVPTSAAPSQGADEEATTEVDLTVVGGKVTGDTGRVRIGLGDRVRLTVTADVADEVHLHGYDLHADTAAGQAASLEFVADRPGIFEVELEESRLALTRLQVQ